MPTTHKARTPKYHTGTRSHLRYVDCSCGWGGRITTPEEAQAEWEKHAAGEVMPWEEVLVAPTPGTPGAYLEYRSHLAAEKAGNTYNVRPRCSDCGYTGKWTQRLHAEDLVAAHRCDR